MCDALAESAQGLPSTSLILLMGGFYDRT